MGGNWEFACDIIVLFVDDTGTAVVTDLVPLKVVVFWRRALLVANVHSPSRLGAGSTWSIGVWAGRHELVALSPDSAFLNAAGFSSYSTGHYSRNSYLRGRRCVRTGGAEGRLQGSAAV